MALELKICAVPSADCSAFNLYEETGVYAVDNTGGYGTPNPDTTDALTAVIDISQRNEDGSYTTPVTIDVFPTLPNVSNTPFLVTALAAGYGTAFPDGVYKITYTVTGQVGMTPFTATVTSYFAFTCGIDCCFKKKAAKLANCNCGCGDLEVQLNEIAVQMQILEYEKGQNNLDAIQKSIKYITNLCDNCGCK
jgi:hypothetical protein